MKLRELALLAGVTALATAAPGWAQTNMNMPGMNMSGMKMAAPKKAAPKKAVPAKKATATTKKPAKPKASGKASTPRRSLGAPNAKASASAATHTGHDMTNMPGMQAPGHDMSNMPGMQAQTQAQGHDMANMPGMQMPAQNNGVAIENPDAEAAGTNLPAGNAPPPPLPTNAAADTVYGAQAMAMGKHHLHEFHGGQKLYQVMFNVAEAQFRNGPNGFEWNGQAWYGPDLNRLWIKSEGDGEFGGRLGKAEVQALYSHAIGPYFNVQGGVRYDIRPDLSRAYAVASIEGLAPSFFDVEGSLFLSTKGELAARVEGSYDQRITQRLILQPRVEVNLAAQDSPGLRIGSGLSDVEAGLRLRYDIRREFAPYVGVQYSRSFGDTRRFQRAAGEGAGGWSLLTGVRWWF